MAWPKKVPVLEASDMVKNRMEDGDCRCLIGWIIDTFGGTRGDVCDYEPSPTAHKVIAMISEETGEWPMALNDEADDLSIPAEAFNAVCRKLGYTVPCER